MQVLARGILGLLRAGVGQFVKGKPLTYFKTPTLTKVINGAPLELTPGRFSNANKVLTDSVLKSFKEVNPSRTFDKEFVNGIFDPKIFSKIPYSKKTNPLLHPKSQETYLKSELKRLNPFGGIAPNSLSAKKFNVNYAGEPGVGMITDKIYLPGGVKVPAMSPFDHRGYSPFFGTTRFSRNGNRAIQMHFGSPYDVFLHEASHAINRVNVPGQLRVLFNSKRKKLPLPNTYIGYSVDEAVSPLAGLKRWAASMGKDVSNGPLSMRESLRTLLNTSSKNLPGELHKLKSQTALYGNQLREAGIDKKSIDALSDLYGFLWKNLREIPVSSVPASVMGASKLNEFRNSRRVY